MEANFEQCCRRRVGGDVPTDPLQLAIRPHHHRHRVPADDALDPAFDLSVAGKLRLVVDRDRVDVRCGDQTGHGDAILGRPFEDSCHQVAGTNRTVSRYDRVERVEPFAGLGEICVDPWAGRAVNEAGWFAHVCESLRLGYPSVLRYGSLRDGNLSEFAFVLGRPQGTPTLRVGRSHGQPGGIAQTVSKTSTGAGRSQDLSQLIRPVGGPHRVCWYMTPAESSTATPKKDLVCRTTFATRADPRLAIRHWVEVWRNPCP